MSSKARWIELGLALSLVIGLAALVVHHKQAEWTREAGRAARQALRARLNGQPFRLDPASHPVNLIVRGELWEVQLPRSGWLLVEVDWARATARFHEAEDDLSTDFGFDGLRNLPLTFGDEDVQVTRTAEGVLRIVWPYQPDWIATLSLERASGRGTASVAPQPRDTDD